MRLEHNGSQLCRFDIYLTLSLHVWLFCLTLLSFKIRPHIAVTKDKPMRHNEIARSKLDYINRTRAWAAVPEPNPVGV
ncbi:hypothetical protein AZKH_1599 [Azoarcus sp. KH32C]|nr:hypothetical protein AZKH_1599 [Azoarcus sp. KH32C]